MVVHRRPSRLGSSIAHCEPDDANEQRHDLARKADANREVREQSDIHAALKGVHFGERQMAEHRQVGTDGGFVVLVEPSERHIGPSHNLSQ